MNIQGRAAIAAALGATLLGSSGVASAQEKEQVTVENTHARDPADRSLELTVGTGYAQGFGNVGTGRPSLGDRGGAGGAVQVGVGYRLIPQLTLGLYGAGSMFDRSDQVDGSTNLYTANAGVQADWHVLPSAHDLDPWLSLGTGWRGYWEHANAGTLSMHGLELARLQVGVDYRLDREIAVSPVIGADLSTFLTEAAPNASFSNIPSPNVNTFVFGGIQGRFDIPVGERTSSSITVASR
jgi:hypothetical protein